MLVEHNSNIQNTFKLAMNKFSDWTDAEYKQILGHKASSNQNNNY